MIIDGQLHEIGPRSRLATPDPAVQCEVLAEIMLASMDAVGVDHAILHPGNLAWGRQMVEHHRDRFSLVPMLDPRADDPREAVRLLHDQESVVGVRLLVGHPSTGEGLALLRDGTWEPFLLACEELGVPAFFFISGFLPEMTSVIRAHPDLTVVIDHLGARQPPTDAPDDTQWAFLPELVGLAVHPNVHVKVCGLPALSRDAYPYEDAWPVVSELLAAFGRDRLFWASDISRFQGRMGWGFEVESAFGQYDGKHTYAQSLAFIQQHPQLSAEDKRALLGGTVNRLLGLGR